MLTYPDGEGADLLVDDGGDATLLIHGGCAAGRGGCARGGPADGGFGRIPLASRRPTGCCRRQQSAITTAALPLPLPLIPTPCPPTPTPLPCPAEGVKAEEAFEKDGSKPDPDSTDNPEFQIVLRIIRDGLEAHPKK